MPDSCGNLGLTYRTHDAATHLALLASFLTASLQSLKFAAAPELDAVLCCQPAALPFRAASGATACTGS